MSEEERMKRAAHKWEWEGRDLIIMRGLPGSGKSTRANEIRVQLSPNGGDDEVRIYSTDDLFVDTQGKYRFEPHRLKENHRETLLRVILAMIYDQPTIILDNTNTQKWQYDTYLAAAKAHGYRVWFCEPDTPWAKDPEECFRRGTHGVPLEKIQAMAAGWEPLPDGAEMWGG